jgi:hypothetical protein
VNYGASWCISLAYLKFDQNRNNPQPLTPMHLADWIVLIAYLIATVAIGVMLGRKVKSTSDLFAAGGASPWWASG